MRTSQDVVVLVMLRYPLIEEESGGYEPWPTPFAADYEAFLSKHDSSVPAYNWLSTTDNPLVFPATSKEVPAQASSYVADAKGVQTPLERICICAVNLFAKVIIDHPCAVLRRQCQVHQMARSLHLTPFTFAPIVCNLIGNEGLQTLYKGCVGSVLLRGLTLTTEFLVAELFNLPRDIVQFATGKRFWNSLFVKTVSCFLMTPFIVSSFIETVRSGTGLTGDDYRLTDVITNGIYRFKSDFVMRDGSKRFSLVYLALPTTTFHITHYLIMHFSHKWIHYLAKRHVDKKPVSRRTEFHRYLPDLFALMSSQVVADFICYPFETVLHRLYIQGTRTLIDNLDTGVSAIPITARYTGLFNCIQRIHEQETAWAFYAGAGALALQYLFNFSFLRLLRTAFDYGMHAFDNYETPPLAVPPVFRQTRSTTPETWDLGELQFL